MHFESIFLLRENFFFRENSDIFDKNVLVDFLSKFTRILTNIFACGANRRYRREKIYYFSYHDHKITYIKEKNLYFPTHTGLGVISPSGVDR